MMITVLAVAKSAGGDNGPWWFAGGVGLAGILLGVLVKSIADALQTRNRDRRDDKLRFIQDKRVAYADFLAACSQVADVERDHRLLSAKGRLIDDSDEPDQDEIDDYNAERERIIAMRTEAYHALTQASSIVELIAPEEVVAAADQLMMRTPHPHLYEPRVKAERAYVDAVRGDLGYAPTSHLPYVVFEPYIDYDDPRSEIDESEWKSTTESSYEDGSIQAKKP